MPELVRTILGLALVARLPRPWRRRRPVVVLPPALPAAEHPAAPYGRRCALLNPFGVLVEVPADAGPAGRHRPRTLIDVVGDDDTPTVRFRMGRTDTELLPRVLLTALAPVPAVAGAR